jgi:hypothetical protein
LYIPGRAFEQEANTSRCARVRTAIVEVALTQAAVTRVSWWVFVVAARSPRISSQRQTEVERHVQATDHDDKGVATHVDPEPCGDVREES